MAKKFTIKKNRLRARSRIRRQTLKTNPVSHGVKTSLQERNRPIIEALEAKLAAQ